MQNPEPTTSHQASNHQLTDEELNHRLNEILEDQPQPGPELSEGRLNDLDLELRQIQANQAEATSAKPALPIKKREMDEDVRELQMARRELSLTLECPICAEPLRDIYEKAVDQCRRGHIVYHSCIRRGEEKTNGRFHCPICRIFWDPVKNIVATAVLKKRYRKMKVKCKHDKCQKVGHLRSLQRNHEGLCLK